MRISLLAVALIPGALRRFRELRALAYPTNATTVWRKKDAQIGNWPETRLRTRACGWRCISDEAQTDTAGCFGIQSHGRQS